MDKISLIKDNIKNQDQQIDQLEKGINQLEFASETIKVELSDQYKSLDTLQNNISENKNNINNITTRVKKLYEKKSCWILSIGILIPLLIIIIIAIIYS